MKSTDKRMIDDKVILPDGRTLTYTDIGDLEGKCVLNFHGAPASRYLFTNLDEEFADRGLRVISPDRPGYGGSSPQPGRSMADWAVDVDALASALKIDSFVVVGSSSGGPYAVACCALLPNRVTGGLIVAGTTDMTWTNAREDYPPVELTVMDLGEEDAAIDWCIEEFGPGGSRFFEGEPMEWPDPDAAFLDDDDNRAHLTTAMKEAFAQGVTGYAQDMIVKSREWPFDPGKIRCPVRVVHGDHDDIVPIAHSRHTAEIIPTARMDIVEGHGHASIADEIPRLTAELVESAGE